MIVTLLIPTLNEIDGMRAIMPQIKREWVDQILIVDGQSTDGTIEYAREHGYEIIIQQKKGMRHAYEEALPRIRGDVLVTFSPDGNSIPELIPVCIAKMKQGYDMVIVSRYAPGAKSQDDDFLTGIGNWVFSNILISIPHGFRYTDAMVIYRAYKKSIVYDLALNTDAPFKVPETLVRINGAAS